MNINFYYVDGLCGSGKTRELVKCVTNNILNEKFLLLFPTINLCNQVYTSFINNGAVQKVWLDIISSQTFYLTQNRAANQC